LGLFLVSFTFAGPWASVFQTPLVFPTAQVTAIVYLITPWSFIPSVRLTAELSYRTIAAPTLAGQVANSLAAVALAFLGFGVWSLVYGMLLAQVISTIAFTIVHPWRFRFSVRKRVAGPLLGYAKHLVTASLLAFLITNIDNFTVGFFFGSTALGFYAVAYGFGYLPISLFSGPAGSALFPSLAKLQGKMDVLGRGYLESYSYATAIIAPASIGVAVVAPEIVHIVLGPKWAPITLPLLVLPFYGLGKALIDFGSSLFAAIGQPRVIAELNLLILVTSVALLFPLTLAYGIVGTAVSMTISVAIVSAVSISRSARILQRKPTEFYACLRGPLIASETMGICVFGLRIWLYGFLPPRIALPFLDGSVSEATVVLILGVSLGILVYFALLGVIDRNTFEGMKRNLLLALHQPNNPSAPR